MKSICSKMEHVCHKGLVCIASRGEVKKLYLKVSPERNRE